MKKRLWVLLFTWALLMTFIRCYLYYVRCPPENQIKPNSLLKPKKCFQSSSTPLNTWYFDLEKNKLLLYLQHLLAEFHDICCWIPNKSSVINMKWYPSKMLCFLMVWKLIYTVITSNYFYVNLFHDTWSFP